ncbi:MAG: DUF3276 family protein [Bacteroidetes bacterium]|nr:DUF3276 family protein [Bacteroidota bacterium]
MESSENSKSKMVFSKSVRAGKRTYFFDVKETRGGDYYIVITESKKQFKTDGSPGHFFMKSKIFLYKEDFDKFCDALSGVCEYIRKEKGLKQLPGEGASETAGSADPGNPEKGGLVDFNFDDLDKV